MDRRRFIGCGLAGTGMAAMSPAICGDNEIRVNFTDNIEKYTREARFYQLTPRGADVSYVPIIAQSPK